MNTPAHVAVNLFLLARKSKPGPDHKTCAVIVAGALLPDLVIIAFYAWQLLLGTPEARIWRIEYYHPLWQAWIDSFNSIPLLGLAMLICWKLRRPILLAFFASMMLHAFGDLPVHHDDGHRHFFPFSEWRFASPVSYWDPHHYGNWFGLLEIGAVIAASWYMIRQSAVLRPWVAVTLVVYLLFWVYVYLVWM